MTKWYFRMRWFYLHKMKYLAKLIHMMVRAIYACDVFPTTDIGEGTRFVHGGVGCVIHERAVIGANCEIYQNVTIGGNGKKDSPWPRVPVIKNNAIICAGACVLGPIVVGNNAVVGANAVVLQDVPDDCVAVGAPARILPKSDSLK